MTILHERAFGTARKIKSSDHVFKTHELWDLSSLDEDDSVNRSFNRLDFARTSVFVTPHCASVISNIVDSSTSEVSYVTSVAYSTY